MSRYKVHGCIFSLGILCLLSSCNPTPQNSASEINTDSLSVVQPVNTISIVSIDTLFKDVIGDSLYLYSGDDVDFGKVYGGKAIDTTMAYQLLDTLLTFKATSNSDFFAISKFRINDTITGYIIRQPGSESSTRLSLFVCNKAAGKFYQRIDLANYVGDEGIEILTESHLDIKGLTIRTVDQRFYNGHPKDSIVHNYSWKQKDGLFTTR